MDLARSSIVLRGTSYRLTASKCVLVLAFFDPANLQTYDLVPGPNVDGRTPYIFGRLASDNWALPE